MTENPLVQAWDAKNKLARLDLQIQTMRDSMVQSEEYQAAQATISQLEFQYQADIKPFLDERDALEQSVTSMCQAAVASGNLTYNVPFGTLAVKQRKTRTVIPLLIAQEFEMETFAQVASIKIRDADRVIGKGRYENCVQKVPSGDPTIELRLNKKPRNKGKTNGFP